MVNKSLVPHGNINENKVIIINIPFSQALERFKKARSSGWRITAMEWKTGFWKVTAVRNNEMGK